MVLWLKKKKKKEILFLPSSMCLGGGDWRVRECMHVIGGPNFN